MEPGAQAVAALTENQLQVVGRPGARKWPPRRPVARLKVGFRPLLPISLQNLSLLLLSLSFFLLHNPINPSSFPLKICHQTHHKRLSSTPHHHLHLHIHVSLSLLLVRESGGGKRITILYLL